jgi:hypothetical protein
MFHTIKFVKFQLDIWRLLILWNWRFRTPLGPSAFTNIDMYNINQEMRNVPDLRVIKSWLL